MTALPTENSVLSARVSIETELWSWSGPSAAPGRMLFLAAMPIKPKPDATFHRFSPEQIEAAIAAVPDVVNDPECDIDWTGAVVMLGGGVKATLAVLRRARGPNKRPTKEQVAIRFSPEVLAYFRATGRGWQTRMDEALREYIASHPR